ncbi:MAG: acyltransferase [Elusimicrobia bacterium]|nr:acyltransferase [Elusimicrobiota bacterium]
MKIYKSHGTGKFNRKMFKKIGENVIFEKGVLVFHPENIEIGSNVYIGHYAFLKGYYKNAMKIGSNTWIGQQVFLHSGGGLEIGNYVGIGPYVKIITLQHVIDKDISRPIITREQTYEKTVIEDDCDIGTGAIILPGIKIGKGSVVGAGSILTKDVKPYSIVVGNPAKLLRKRK